MVDAQQLVIVTQNTCFICGFALIGMNQPITSKASLNHDIPQIFSLFVLTNH